jgi:hypothetical protein
MQKANPDAYDQRPGEGFVGMPGSDVETKCLCFLTNYDAPRLEGLEEIMLASNTYLAGQDIFDGKSQAVRDLYNLLVDELKKLGPVQEIKKAISISLENCRPFASVLIRNRSIKLVLRTQHRIANQRILSIDRVADKSFDHTVVLDSKNDIDGELMKWLGEAYHLSK